MKGPALYGLRSMIARRTDPRVVIAVKQVLINVNLCIATLYLNDKPCKYVDTQKYLGIEIKGILSVDLFTFSTNLTQIIPLFN